MTLQTLLVVTTLVALDARADALASARAFVDGQLKPMLRGRDRHARIRVVAEDGGSARIELESRTAGTYDISIDPTVEAPSISAPEIEISPNFFLRGRTTLPVDWRAHLAAAAGNVRRLLRADPFLHPTNRPRGAPVVLSPPQREVLAAMHAQQRRAVELGEAQRSLVLMPPGTGKTVVTGEFANDLAAAGDDVLLVYVVQSTELRQQSGESLAAQRDLQADEVRRSFRDARANGRFDARVKLVTSSRTLAHRDLPEFLAATRDYPGRIVYVLDEAHHIGRAEGEFQTLLERLDVSLRPRDVLLGLTGTPWHTDAGPIHRFFRDNVAAAFVEPGELERYVAEGRWVELSRLIFFRAMRAGFLSSIHEYRRVDYFGIGRVLTRKYLRDSEVEVSGLDDAARTELFKRTTYVHEPFVKKMVDEIRRTIRRDHGHVTYYNRGLIFVPSIAHAEAYAEMMQRLAPPGERIAVRAYHSDLDPKPRGDTLEWFKADAHEHRYLIVIDTLGEGFDLPRINHLMLAKPYGENDLVGMRRLLQHLGRAARIGSFKSRLWITDFTGDMQRLIFTGLDEVLIKAAFTDADRPGVRDLLRRIREYVTKTDDRTMKFGAFEQADVPVPIDDLAKYEVEGRPWTFAHLLLDTKIMRKLVPAGPFTKKWAESRHRRLGDYLCAYLAGRDRQFDVDEYGLAKTLIAALDLTRARLDADTAVRTALERLCDGPIFRATREDKRPTAAELARHEREMLVAAPSVFGRTVRVSDADINNINNGEALHKRGALIPWMHAVDQTAAHARWRRPWSLAEVLLNPLVPKSIGMNGVGLGLAIARGSFKGLPEDLARRWRDLPWRDALARADALGALGGDTGRFTLDGEYRRRVIETLIAVDPELFGAPTAWTDERLVANLDLRKAPGTARSWAYFALAGLHRAELPPERIRELSFPHLDPALVATPPTFDGWATPWPLARVLVHPWSKHLTVRSNFGLARGLMDLPQIARARSQGLMPEDLAPDDHAGIAAATSRLIEFDPEFFRQPISSFSEARVLRLYQAPGRLDEDTHRALMRYLKAFGPLPDHVGAASTRAAPEAAEEAHFAGWSLARLLLDTRALTALAQPASAELSTRFGMNLGQFLCDELSGRAQPGAEVVRDVLARLDLDRGRWSELGHLDALRRACANRMFELRLGSKWTETRMTEAEAALIDLARDAFGTPTSFTFDQATGPGLHTPDQSLVPRFARPVDERELDARWYAPWSLARVLLDPVVVNLGGRHAEDFGSALLRSIKRPNLNGEFLSGPPEWRDQLPAALVDAERAGFFQDRDWTWKTPAVVDAAEAKLVALNPALFGQLTAVTFATVNDALKRLSPSNPARRMFGWSAWFHGLRRTPAIDARPAARLELGPLRLMGDDPRPANWRTKWTLARVLLLPAGSGLGWPTSVGAKARTLGQQLADLERLNASHVRPLAHFNGGGELLRVLSEPASIAAMSLAARVGLLQTDLAPGDEAALAAVERALIAIAPDTFGRELATFDDERIGKKIAELRRTQHPPAELIYAFRTYIASRGPAAEDCEGPLTDARSPRGS